MIFLVNFYLAQAEILSVISLRAIEEVTGSDIPELVTVYVLCQCMIFNKGLAKFLSKIKYCSKIPHLNLKQTK